MPGRILLLIKVFRIELEEAEINILELLEYYSNRFDCHEITPYVWKENRALLKKEISCVEELVKDLAEWKPPDATEPQKVLTTLNMFLKDKVKTRGYPELVNLVIDRISKKVSRYLE